MTAIPHTSLSDVTNTQPQGRIILPDGLVVIAGACQAENGASAADTDLISLIQIIGVFDQLGRLQNFFVRTS